MRALILIAAALAIPAHGDDEHKPLPLIPMEAPWMTGAQLLQKLAKPAEATAAEDYIRGVYDATEHRDWCHAAADGKALPKPRPAEMQAQIRSALGEMSAEQLKRNAAALLIEFWQDRWACPPDRCCHD